MVDMFFLSKVVYMLEPFKMVLAIIVKIRIEC